MFVPHRRLSLPIWPLSPMRAARIDPSFSACCISTLFVREVNHVDFGSPAPRSSFTSAGTMNPQTFFISPARHPFPECSQRHRGWSWDVTKGHPNAGTHLNRAFHGGVLRLLIYAVILFLCVWTIACHKHRRCHRKRDAGGGERRGLTFSSFSRRRAFLYMCAFFFSWQRRQQKL